MVNHIIQHDMATSRYDLIENLFNGHDMQHIVSNPLPCVWMENLKISKKFKYTIF